MKPTHRDDLDPEVIAALEQQFPGMKIVCAGDAPEGTLPPEVAEWMADLERKHDHSLVNGLCIDCGVKMPGFPENGELSDDWQPDNGWAWFMSGDDIAAWQCPECDANDKIAEITQ